MAGNGFLRWSVRGKLRLLIVAPPCLILLLNVVIGEWIDVRMLREEMAKKAHMRMSEIAVRIDDLFERMDTLVQAIALHQQSQQSNGAVVAPETNTFLRKLLVATPLAEAVYIAFEDRDYRNENAMQLCDRLILEQGRRKPIGYDYHDKKLLQSKWYCGARELKDSSRPFITQPYFDEGGASKWIVSITRAIRDEQGKFLGVAGVDLALEELNKFIGAYRDSSGEHVASPTGSSKAQGKTAGQGASPDQALAPEMAYLASPRYAEDGCSLDEKGHGSMVFALPHSLLDYLVKKTVAGSDQKAVNLDDMIWFIQGADGILREVESNTAGVQTRIGGRDYRTYWTTCPQSRWKVIFQESEDSISALARRSAVISLAIGAVFLVAMLWFLAVLADHVIGPIHRLTEAAALVESGHYHYNLELDTLVARTDESGQLARAFQRMVDEVAAREGQLLQEQKELDRRVRERTDDLRTALDELRVAKEATDQAMKQQEIFLANVAHDLRSPLSIVLGYSEDLLRQARRAKQEAFINDLKLIVKKGNDLLELINDLLNLSRSMGEKGIALDIEDFDVVAMLQDRMEGIGSIAKKNRNVIEFQPAEGGVGCMTADKVKVWRILMNLLSNACKFTHNGTVTLTVERESVGNQHQIIFRVRDTGPGISPENQKFLFQRFFQTSSSPGPSAPGVGLGLSICMLYCEAMGGTISVKSELGKGSIFTVSLPAKVSAAHSEAPIAGPPAVQPAPQPASVETPAAESPTPAKGQDAGLVLVVDDDAAIGDLIRRNLVEEGFRTQTALNGEEGIRLAKQLVPSAIVLDIVMPGIDGWGVLAALRADARTAGIPIIVASIIEEKERGLNLGAQDYVTKPLSRERLSRFLHQHLDSGPPARILVVENDPKKQDRLSTMLREQGWEVLTAPDGGDALRRLSLGTPDLILLDVMIPSINGRQLIAEIRNNPDCESIPIVVLTAEGASAEDLDPIKEQVDQIMSLGAHDRDELFREIRYLVAVRRRRVSTPTTEAGHG